MDKQKKILVVDDDEDVRNLIIETLEVIPNVKIISAEDGALGKKAYIKEAPSILVTDVRMPKLDGLTMVKELIVEKVLRNPRSVIMISGFESEEAKTKAMMTGITFLPKPFAEDKLMALVVGMITDLMGAKK